MFSSQISRGILFFLLIVSALWTGCQRQPQVEETKTLSQPGEASVTREEHQIKKETEQYAAVLKSENPPLTTKEERLELEIKDKATGQPIEHEHLSVRTYMQTEDHLMEAPTAIHELSAPDVYEIETTFLMPGTWTIEVKREPTKEKLVSFEVKVEGEPN